jgi:hypothetical protein
MFSCAPKRAIHGTSAIGDRKASLSDPFGFQLAMRAPLPLAGPLENMIVVGVALHLLPDKIARVIAPPPDQPFYPYYGDRLSRIVVLPGAAVQLPRGFAFGFAVNVLAGLAGTITASEGATRAVDARVDERVPTIARAVLGASWQAAPAWRVGLVFRQRFEIPFDTQSTTEVAGEPIDLDLARVGTVHAAPAVRRRGVVAGAFTASLDVGYSLWSDYPGPFVRVDSALPSSGRCRRSRRCRSTRCGARGPDERRRLDLRGGYGFETSPVPRSTRRDEPARRTAPHVGAGVGYPSPPAVARCASMPTCNCRSSAAARSRRRCSTVAARTTRSRA